jgi:hypothetical protein
VNRTPAILVAALTAMSLAACASATSASPREGSASSGEPSAEPNVPVQIAEGTIARGELLLADGSSFGEASIDWVDGGIVVHVPDLTPLRSGGSSIMPALADGEVAIGDCGEPNVWALGIGEIPQPAPLPVPEFMGDPSFLRYLLIVEPGSIDGDCAQPIRALARLEWDVPEVRPWIDVVDTGERAGAHGAVKLREGRPVLYRTAPGDDWVSIAQRFDLDADDLSYLNPIRLGNSEPGVAYADQVLNLDPGNRGDSETRRPGAPLTEPDAF